MRLSDSFLEKPRAIRTLICLLRAEGKGLDEVLREIGGSKTTGMKRIAELIELGLVNKRASPEESRKMLYSLTQKGTEVASGLKRLIEEIEKGEE